MAEATTRLTVFAHLLQGWAPCGQLDLTESGATLMASAFAYGLKYLRRKDAIEVDPVSLGIRERESVEARRLFPRNQLAAFGGIRDAAPDAWGRRVIEAKLKVPANSLPESAYLLHAGSERVGALDVRSGLDDAPSAGVTGVKSLAYLVEAADRIEAGLPVPAHLDAIFVDGSALGGARPKASVRDEAGVLWLAKFPSRTDPFNVPTLECATLQLAARAGLTVPSVHVRKLGERQVMLIRRFDRFWTTPDEAPRADAATSSVGPERGYVERRIPFVSGLTFVGCDESESHTKSYADLADAVRRYCHTSVIRRDNAELFKRMIYNIFVSNDDDHLRNHGFVWDAHLGGWRLSPLYDVMPRSSGAQERVLHLGVGPQGRLATLDNALDSHERFTLSRRVASQLIDDVWRVVREWRVFFDEFSVSAADIERIAPAFRHIDDISSAALRKQLA